MSEAAAWAFVVPVKGGTYAKSRLRAALGPAGATLAGAFARDTVCAIRSGMPESPVLVVTADESVAEWAVEAGCVLVADPGQGLDAAVAHGVAKAREHRPDVSVVLGDHPALRPEEVTAAAGAAAAYPASFVPDGDGSGTAGLFLRAGSRVWTAFGSDSARRHESAGYARLDLDLPGLREDVDDAAGLERARRLGAGVHTRAVLDGSVVPVQASIHTVTPDGGGTALLDDGTEVTFAAERIVESGLLHVRTGQRVSVELSSDGSEAARVWIVGIGPGEVIR